MGITIPTRGHVMVIIRVVCQNMDRKVPQGLQCAFNGKGVLLPSVAGSGALQPCVRRLKQSIIVVGNKHQLPAKSWSALSVPGSFSYPANHFGSRNVSSL